jgi:hypothetical protein
VVLEGEDVFVPPWQLSGDIDGHEFSEPDHVLDFHLSQFEVAVKDSVMEPILEGIRVALGFCHEHYVINALALRVKFSTSCTFAHLAEHLFVFSALNSRLKLIETVSIAKFLVSVGIKISKRINILSSLSFTALGI